ncbi:MAG TPA: hypothetical protein VN281_18875, partial [Verrucomicrobiae bacterium]|nr:hypothetical protein [Verrucomicrobiae bacterium]
RLYWFVTVSRVGAGDAPNGVLASLRYMRTEWRDRPSLGSFRPASKAEEPPSLRSFGAPSKVLWNGLERSKFDFFDMWAN